MNMQVQEAPNNAGVEIQRRRAIIEAREREAGQVAAHRANVPDQAVARNPMAHPSRMQLAQFTRQNWTHNAEEGITVEDCLKPAYWSHMAQKMTAYDHIEVRADDGSWVAEFLVVQVDRMWAKVKTLWKFDLAFEDGSPDLDLHTVKWRGPHNKFAVIRNSDSAVIRENFATKIEGETWMREHERVISG